MLIFQKCSMAQEESANGPGAAAAAPGRCCGNASEISTADNLGKKRFHGNLLIGVGAYLGYRSAATCVNGTSFRT